LVAFGNTNTKRTKINEKNECNFKLIHKTHSFNSLSFVFFVCVAIGNQGKRESNTLVIYLEDEHNPAKAGIILDNSEGAKAILT